MLHKLNNFETFLQITNEHNVKIGVFSDFHVGSQNSIKHPTAKFENGTISTQSVHQEAMYNNLHSALDKLELVDIMLSLGDMVEGRNVKACGLDLSTTNTDVMTDWAFEIEAEIINKLKPKIFIGIPGSNYHAQDSGSDMDYRVVHRLSLHFPNIEFYYGQPAQVIIGRKVWFLSHNIGGDWKRGAWPMLDRMYRDHLESSYETGEQMPGVLGYGHKHRATNVIEINVGNKEICYGFVAPCQKLGDVYLSKTSYKRRPTIGFMIIEQNDLELTGTIYRTYEPWKKS